MTHRTPLVVGNWKLHLTMQDATSLAAAIDHGLRGTSIEVGVAPVSLSISSVTTTLRESPVRVFGQHTHHEDKGAFTGEVSPFLLADAGCDGCLVGHSERRHLFGERDEDVTKKVRALLHHSLVPIVCVGETLEERESGHTERVVLGQVRAAIQDAQIQDATALCVAYEPVWAIGTGRTASPEDAQDVHRAIRDLLSQHFGDALAQGIRILYGGSVKPNNAKALLEQQDIDGALVGGASLQSDSFLSILRAAESAH